MTVESKHSLTAPVAIQFYISGSVTPEAFLTPTGEPARDDFDGRRFRATLTATWVGVAVALLGVVVALFAWGPWNAGSVSTPREIGVVTTTPHGWCKVGTAFLGRVPGMPESGGLDKGV
ncbi:hypothetical protein [Nocardia concava]|uniref:hypothetical protein n=1 Tax=Nocardia concava TaxID=257281 RepID=UPI00030DCFF1|nr:hypothetical protein [Nocardia concava]